MKAIQYFSPEYLEHCRQMTPSQIVKFLEEFRRLHAPQTGKSKLISMKIPIPLLEAFKTRCRLQNIAYQTRIKELMTQWLRQ